MNEISVRGAFGASSLVSNDIGASSLELFEDAASLVSLGAFSCDLASDRLTWTRGLFDLFGLSDDQVPERQATVALYDEESREMLERKRSRAIATRSGFSLDASIVRPDGAERRIRITAATRGSNGRVEVLYGMKQDITEDHARWETLRTRAECDPLTGVANRARFQSFLNQSNCELALNPVGALILFDMDGFKQVNDWWGHSAGDACLVAFGERLRKSLPQARLISRIGGDEFAVLYPPITSRKDTESALRQTIEKILSPVPWNGNMLPLRVSVGLAFVSPETALNPQKLFVAADEALYSAKKCASTFIVSA